MNEAVTSVVVIPSYNETLALPVMLSELAKGLSSSDAVIIMDDSFVDTSSKIDLACSEVLANTPASYYFFNHQGKSGRGAAIRRGMVNAVSLFPNLEYITECDADGSHRPIDILKVKESSENFDLLVGSRYLQESQIVGWPLSRRIFSYILNHFIPRILSIQIRDITNGLRRYSLPAVELILLQKQENSGFIYLSEQAVVVRNSGLRIGETPITFVDRTLGSSTVTWREIVYSIKGVVLLISQARKK
ncbi:MAG: glycosyltransferase [Actinobacteria bacterium]|nr:glycosyltransferase [Actinomycetota bacterium]